MAFATLPYPSMDFVPLDVLTADELDQIVANINAVNNGSAGTAQIADGAITTQKLNSTALGVMSYNVGDVVTFTSQKLPLLIVGSGGAQEYFLPVSKSLDRVTGATVRITSASSSNSFRTIDTDYGAGKPTENVDYAGTLVGNGIKFTATLRAGSSNGHINGAQLGVASIGTIRVTFS